MFLMENAFHAGSHAYKNYVIQSRTQTDIWSSYLLQFSYDPPSPLNLIHIIRDGISGKASWKGNLEKAHPPRVAVVATHYGVVGPKGLRFPNKLRL